MMVNTVDKFKILNNYTALRIAHAFYVLSFCLLQFVLEICRSFCRMYLKAIFTER